MNNNQLLKLLKDCNEIIGDQLLPNAAKCFGLDLGQINDTLVTLTEQIEILENQNDNN